MEQTLQDPFALETAELEVGCRLGHHWERRMEKRHMLITGKATSLSLNPHIYNSHLILPVMETYSLSLPSDP